MDGNEILKQITFRIYKERPAIRSNMRTNYRIERVCGDLLCDLWFLTTGCRHDAQGGCVMCNYGKNTGEIDEERILYDLRQIVTRFPFEFGDFLLTSSGSLLDEREVPDRMREKLLLVLKDIRAKRVIVETRADTVTEAGLEFVKRLLPDSEKYIEIGVESSNNWILKHCINKGTDFQTFQKAVEQIHGKGIFVTANIGIGAPFMSERAAVRYAVRSIQDVLEAGADSVVVFPYHVKHGTLLDVMYREGMYQPVSLWSLVEVLNHFTGKELLKIQISWYKDYFGEENSYIYRSPVSCPECQEYVMRELDYYRDRQDHDRIRKLSESACQCREEWKGRLVKEADSIQIDAAEEMYRKLSRLYEIDEETTEKELYKMRQDYARDGIFN